MSRYIEYTKQYKAATYRYFHPLEVVSRYRDPQPQVGENIIGHTIFLQYLMFAGQVMLELIALDVDPTLVA